MEFVVRSDVMLFGPCSAAVLVFADGQRAMPGCVQGGRRTVSSLETIWRDARNDVGNIPRGWSRRNEAVYVPIEPVSNRSRYPRSASRSANLRAVIARNPSAVPYDAARGEYWDSAVMRRG